MPRARHDWTAWIAFYGYGEDQKGYVRAGNTLWRKCLTGHRGNSFRIREDVKRAAIALNPWLVDQMGRLRVLPAGVLPKTEIR